MKKQPNKTFAKMVILAYSLLFFVSNIIPIVGPSFLAYAFGFSMYRIEHYGLSKIHILISMTIGELIFFIISFLIIKASFLFYNPETFWYLIIIGFISNYLFSIIFYFLGLMKLKSKKQNIQ